MKPVKKKILIPLAEVLKLTPEKPLFGHPTGRKHSDTHWVTYMKPEPPKTLLEESEEI